jgi:hypothetical protein
MIFVASSSGQARAVWLRTKPRLPLANAYLAMFSPFAVSMICSTSCSPEVRKICLISHPHFFARSCAACARLRSSLISRMPRSVKFKDMTNSTSLSHGSLCHSVTIASVKADEGTMRVKFAPLATSAFGTWRARSAMSAFGGKADKESAIRGASRCAAMTS